MHGVNHLLNPYTPQCNSQNTCGVVGLREQNRDSHDVLEMQHVWHALVVFVCTRKKMLCCTPTPKGKGAVITT